MPELPETETIASDLNRLLQGARFGSTTVLRSDVVRGPLSDFRSVPAGKVISRVWRRGKTVVLDLEPGYHLLVTPRFTGALLVGAPDLPPSPHDAVRWQLDGARVLTYRDMRRLGTVRLVDPPGLAEFSRRHGPEPLGPAFTGEALSGILRVSTRAIKRVLMDPARLAGIGNIYANEALWMAGIDPSLPARQLDAERTSSLHAALVDLLARAIEARGTTFRDFRDPSDREGGFASQLRVYGQDGRPCRRCGTRITRTLAVDGRGTYFCHRCQS